MERDELLRIAEGGNAWLKAWSARPLGWRIARQFRSEKGWEQDAMKAALRLGQGRRNMIVMPWILIAWSLGRDAMDNGLPGLDVWQRSLPVVAVVVGTLVVFRGMGRMRWAQRRFDERAAEAYAVIDRAYPEVPSA